MMHPNNSIFQPKTLSEAVQLLAMPETMPMIVQPKPVSPLEVRHMSMVDLSQLNLDYIQENNDGHVVIGSMATLQTIVDSPVIKQGERALLVQAAALITTPAIRNIASIWGSLQDYTGPPEVMLALLTAGAHVIIIDSIENEHKLNLCNLLGMESKTLLNNGLVVEVQLPQLRPLCGWALERVARTPKDEAIVAATAILETEDEKIRHVSLALAGANPQPKRLQLVEEFLVGKSYPEITSQKIEPIIKKEIKPTGDLRGGSEYRAAMAVVMVHRALKNAWECQR